MEFIVLMSIWLIGSAVSIYFVKKRQKSVEEFENKRKKRQKSVEEFENKRKNK